jgi:hypothetical protein
VNGAGFTPRQRLTIMLLVMAVVAMFALLAGFIVTSLQGLEQPAALPLTPPASPSPSATPSATPTQASQEGLWSQVQAARLFDQIAHQVETERGLSPQAEVPLNFLDGREMTKLLYQLYVEREPQAQVLRYTILGLLPQISVSIHAHQAAGVYVPEQEQVYIATGQQGNSADDQALLAHAYAHALQDQRFDLQAMEDRATTTDGVLAVRALAEGDATLLTAFYRYEDVAMADWEYLAELIVQAEQPGHGEALDRSAAWARLQRFPYREGRQFTEAVFQAGGWEAINLAYSAPPRSTEQVLHPERYLEERDDPARVVVPDLSAGLGEEWELVFQDTFGEFVMGLYLNQVLPEERAWQAADGWDGDTFVAWEENGNQVRVWRTIWESTADAVEFERALVAVIPQRDPPAWPVKAPGDLAGEWWETGTGAATITRAGRYVTLAEAPEVDLLAQVVEVLP